MSAGAIYAALQIKTHHSPLKFLLAATMEASLVGVADDAPRGGEDHSVFI